MQCGNLRTDQRSRNRRSNAAKSQEHRRGNSEELVINFRIILNWILKYTGCKDIEYIHRAVVNTVMKFQAQ